MKKDMEYSFGVPVRNEENNLERCVENLLIQTVVPSRIYICLNGSNEETRNVAGKLEREHEKVKVLESAPGKARAWNRIFSHTAENFIYFTDGDTLSDKNSAEKMLEVFDSNSHLSVVGGNFRYQRPSNGFFSLPLFNFAWNRNISPLTLCGACYMINRENISEVAETLGIKLMPDNIIVEDAFIGGIAQYSGTFSRSDASVLVKPAGTLIDYIRVQRRIKAGLDQLDSQFPEIFENGRPINNSPLNSNRKLIPPEVLFARKCAHYVRKAVHFSLKAFPHRLDGTWTEIKSTKSSFYN